MQKIISLSGEMMAGKDEFAKPLLEMGWIKGSFAANLKSMCGEIFNLTDYDLNDPTGKAAQLSSGREFNSESFMKIIEWMKKTHDVADMATHLIEINSKYIVDYYSKHGCYKTFSTPREILQFIGTEICRFALDTYHTDVMFKFISSNIDKNIVITDSRFPNERKLLKDKFNATLVRILRFSNTEGKLLHASENSLGDTSEYDIVVTNDKTIEDLHRKAKTLVGTRFE